MNTDPGRNSVTCADVLFDVPAEELAAPVCARPGCGNPVPVAESGRGRPTLYCSRSCKSKVARIKAAASRTVPGQPVPVPEGPRAALLGHVAELQDAARAFLAAVNIDPVAAFEEFFQQSYSLGARAREAAADARDEVRWPGLTGPELELRRAEETLMRPDVLARISPAVRADTARAANEPAAGTVTKDGETARAADTAGAAGSGEPANTARAEIRTTAPVPAPAAALPDDELLRRAYTDPRVRFGTPDLLDDLGVTVGEGWELGSWTDPDADRVHQLLRDGASIGWINPLPEGRWGQAGWIAVLNLDGRRAVVITDDLGRPRTHRKPGEALDTLHRAYRERLDPAAPRLALKRPTGWSAPSARGLGTPDRSHALGEGLAHLTWPAAPGVQELQRDGRSVGWIELYDVERGTWIALIDSSIVTNAASGEPLRCATAADALALLRLALGQHLGR